MRKLKITIGRFALRVDLYDTATAAAIAAAAPFESRASIWPGEVYFQAPVAVEREDGARDVVEPGEVALRVEGEAIIIGFGPTPCSEGDEIRLATQSNIWGRTADDLTPLVEVEAGQLVRVDAVDDPA